jgi:ferredoxin-NADP reductase
MVFQSFSSVMLVAGGSGITHSLGIAHDLIRKASVAPYNVRARSVTIIWATRTTESVEGLLPSFNKLIQCGHKAEQESPYGTTLRIYVYVTRQPASLPMRIESVVPPSMLIGGNRNSESTMTSQELSTSGVQIISGIRPNFEVSLNEMIESTGTLETGNSRGGLSRDVKPQGIAVAVCGPDALVVSAREAVRGIAQSKISRVGGIELLEESFCH